MNNFEFFHTTYLPKIAGCVDSSPMPGTDYIYEPKLDGIRCFLVARKGEVTLFSLKGVDITSRFPEVAEEAEKIYARHSCIVLDGELVHMTDVYDVDFHAASVRHGQQRSEAIALYRDIYPMTFVFFDVLQSASKLIYKEALIKRKKVLSKIPRGKFVQEIPYSLVREEMMNLTKETEGYIFKNKESSYGDRWGKRKNIKDASVIVTSTLPGDHLEVGSITINLLGSDGKLIPAGHISGTFNDSLSVKEYLESSPKIPLVLDVQYLGWSMRRDGSVRLRDGTGKMIRYDKDPYECTLSQLT